MNYIKSFISLLIFTPLLVACFEDETTEATRPLSEISIQEGSIQSVYNINKNETLVISPVITQSNTEKALSYTWEINLKEYSHEKDFNYVGKTLGTFNCRLIVENEDGKTFQSFKLNVNTPYEEGLVVVSSDDDGRPMMVFMRTPLTDDEEKSFTTYDCLTVNNPDITFSSNPADMVQAGNFLFLISQGGDTEDDAPAVYYINQKTLVVENMFTVPEYSEYKPKSLIISSSYSDYAKFPIISENGDAYDFSPFNSVVQPSTILFSNYSTATIADESSSGYYSLIVWDKEAKALAMIYYGYGPYYFGSEYHLSNTNSNFESLNYFSGQELITMVPIAMTTAQRKIYDGEALILTKKGILNYRTVIGTVFWGYDYTNLDYILYDNGGYTMIGMGSCPIDESTPCIANKTYYSLLFAEGNKVRSWNYTSTQQISAAKEICTVGSDNAVITGFEISADHMSTYVSFYEPEQDGFNGSVWVIDTEKGTVLERYDNICRGKPVIMFYKEK